MTLEWWEVFGHVEMRGMWKKPAWAEILWDVYKKFGFSRVWIPWRGNCENSSGNYRSWLSYGRPWTQGWGTENLISGSVPHKLLLSWHTWWMVFIYVTLPYGKSQGFAQSNVILLLPLLFKRMYQKASEWEWHFQRHGPHWFTLNKLIIIKLCQI